MKDEWWKKKAEEIQGYADSKNAKLFYSSLREVYGPPQRSAALIRNLQGELLIDNKAINQRWSEHFEQLLNRPSSIDPSVIEQIQSRPLHMELDDPPTKDEVAGAIAELQCGGPAAAYQSYSRALKAMAEAAEDSSKLDLVEEEQKRAL
ncbi:hypothetical protein ACOMHN_010973 [Nucella lapillus]